MTQDSCRERGSCVRCGRRPVAHEIKIETRSSAKRTREIKCACGWSVVRTAWSAQDALDTGRLKHVAVACSCPCHEGTHRRRYIGAQESE